MSTKVYVGNLPETVRKSDLQEKFEAYGKVVECDIVTNYAFVVSAENPSNVSEHTHANKGQRTAHKLE